MTQQRLDVVDVDFEDWREHFDLSQERLNVEILLLAKIDESWERLEIWEDRGDFEALEADHGAIVGADHESGLFILVNDLEFSDRLRSFLKRNEAQRARGFEVLLELQSQIFR